MIPDGQVGSAATTSISHREMLRFGFVRLTVGQGTEVGFLIVSFGVKRVGDTGQVGLEKRVFQRIVESLEVVLAFCCIRYGGPRTEPVRTLRDLVVHVPTKSLTFTPAATVAKSAHVQNMMLVEAGVSRKEG